MENRDSHQNDAKMTPLEVAQSVAAAAFGVQSSRNQARDFSKGSAKTFIIAGVIGTLLFIATVATVVMLVLR
jgi:hypothetical protein